MKRTLPLTQFLSPLYCAAATVVMSFAMTASAVELNVAVAANIKPALEVLATRFKEAKGHTLHITSAASGTLFNQISHGAPFDLFLSADTERPERLEREGKIVSGSRQVYATGLLALWDNTSRNDLAKTGRPQQPMTIDDLRTFAGRLAIGNPATAPYGYAAQQAMERTGIWQQYKGRLVQGASIAQTWQFVATNNVPVGFVALSQLSGDDLNHATVVDPNLYDPIRQEMVILKRTQHPKVAAELQRFLLSAESQTYLTQHGYGSAATGGAMN